MHFSLQTMPDWWVICLQGLSVVGNILPLWIKIENMKGFLRFFSNILVTLIEIILRYKLKKVPKSLGSYPLEYTYLPT